MLYNLFEYLNNNYDLVGSGPNGKIPQQGPRLRLNKY